MSERESKLKPVLEKWKMETETKLSTTYTTKKDELVRKELEIVLAKLSEIEQVCQRRGRY